MAGYYRYNQTTVSTEFKIWAKKKYWEPSGVKTFMSGSWGTRSLLRVNMGFDLI